MKSIYTVVTLLTLSCVASAQAHDATQVFCVTHENALNELENFELSASHIPDQVITDLACMLDQLTTLLENADVQKPLSEETIELMASIVTTILTTSGELHTQTVVKKTQTPSSENIQQGTTPLHAQKIELVLTAFTTLAGNVATLMTAQRNPRVISACVLNMLVNLANLVQKALKKGSDATPEYLATYLAAHESTHQKLVHGLENYLIILENT